MYNDSSLCICMLNFNQIKSINQSTGRYQAYCVKIRVNAFSHCVTQTCVLLPQIMCYSDTKVPVLVVMECKCDLCIRVDIFYFIFQGQQSTVMHVQNMLHLHVREMPRAYKI